MTTQAQLAEWQDIDKVTFETEYQRGFLDALWQFYNFTGCQLSKLQAFFDKMELDKGKYKDHVNYLQENYDDYDVDFVGFFGE